MTTTNNSGKVRIQYAILENGLAVTGDHRVGDVIQTQWGGRHVIAIKIEHLDVRPTEPYGV